MLDQSFSSSNFNTIFLKENRKGNIGGKYLSDVYKEKHEQFKSVLKEKIELRKTKPDGKLSKEELDKFANLLKEINDEKEQIRLKQFDEYSRIINDIQTPFQFKIDYYPEKDVYSIEKDAVSFYTIKQLQYNIHKAFKVKQADRNQIIKQIYNLISDGFPKIIIRTDIKSFYESIPQDWLFKKIENDTLLSPFSKRLLKRLFYSFEDIKDKTKIAVGKGVPRGIGVSAYLSELYMRDIDNEIKNLDDIIYYARYVDDIIIIFSPKTKSQIRNYLDEIKKIISNNELEIKDGSDGNESKTTTLNLTEKALVKCENINYLGYKFIIKQNLEVAIEISDNKIERYKERLKSTIETYNKDALSNEKMARKMLFDRLKFLTGNFHLNNNKRNIKSGVYYSNRMIELNKKYGSLKNLDNQLSLYLALINPPIKIGIDKLKMTNHLKDKFSFIRGFEKKEKHFYSFNFNRQEEKYYRDRFKRLTNKFEVIKSIWR